MTRRDFHKLGLASVAATTAPATCPSHAAQPLDSLKDAAATKNIRFGAFADVNLAEATPSYRAVFQNQCDLCAVDIWAPMFSAEPGRLSFANPENARIHAATEDGFKITGAHLLWYYHMPDWFVRTTGRKEAEKAICDYAYGIASNYRGRAWSWNVVNEALDPRNGQPLGLRQCWPLQQVGPDYIDMTFRAARRADGEAVLAYNDADMELDTPEQENRRVALLSLIDDLRRRETPIDAVGLQSHLRYEGFSRFHPKAYRAFLAEIASRGLKIIITELDVLDVGMPSDKGQRDTNVADIYHQFLSAALDEPAVKAVVTWGLSDRYSWLNQKDYRPFARTDGLAGRPLPFDDDLEPTPAFDAILNAFRAAPSRP